MNRMMFVAFVACATVVTGVAVGADEPNEVAAPKVITV